MLLVEIGKLWTILDYVQNIFQPVPHIHPCIHRHTHLHSTCIRYTYTSACISPKLIKPGLAWLVLKVTQTAPDCISRFQIQTYDITEHIHTVSTYAYTESAPRMYVKHSLHRHWRDKRADRASLVTYWVALHIHYSVANWHTANDTHCVRARSDARSRTRWFIMFIQTDGVI